MDVSKRVSQRGNNNMNEFGVTGNNSADYSKIMQQHQQVRRQIRAGDKVPDEVRQRFEPIRLNTPAKGKLNLDIDDVPVKSRTFKVSWEGTLSQWKRCGEEGVVWQVPDSNAWVFQDLDSDGAPTGDLRKVYPVRASTSNHKSTLPFDTCVKIPGMEGKIYLKNGIQTAVHLPAGSTGTDNTRVQCHELDKTQMRLAELNCASITEEMLWNECHACPHEPGDIEEREYMVLPNSEIARVLSKPKNMAKLKINPDQRMMYKNKATFFYEHEISSVIESIKEKQKNIKVPFVNLFKWPIQLIKEDNTHWSDVDTDPAITTVGEKVSEHLLNKHQTVSFLLHFDYIIASGKEWQNAVTPN